MKLKALVALAALALAVPATGLGAPTMLAPNLQVNTVATGLTTPTTMAFLGPNDMFVLEKSTGVVKRITGSTTTTVLDLGVNSSSERGLLGIALHPNFPTNHGVYLYWTCQAPPPPPDNPFFPVQTECPDTPLLGFDTSDILAVPLLGNRVDRFVWNGSTLTFDRNLVKLRVFQNDGAPTPPNQGDESQPARGNHDGGPIAFGPDGKLYIVVGDTAVAASSRTCRPAPPRRDSARPCPTTSSAGPSRTRLTSLARFSA